MSSVHDLPYPQRLIVELLHFAIWHSEKTKDLKFSEINKGLAVFFDEAEIQKAKDILTGERTC